MVSATNATFSLANPIEAIGSVTFHGSAGDSAAGWTIGFVQAQWVETNWGVYRGAAPSDGSVFVQRARPPSRPHQACFTTKADDELADAMVGVDLHDMPDDRPMSDLDYRFGAERRPLG